MGVEVEDVALPVDPEVHVVAGFLPEQLEAHLGVGGEVLFGIEEGEHEAVVLGTVEVAEHEGEPPEVGLGAEPGEGVDAVLILVALPSGDVVEGVVGIAVGAVEEHEVGARLEAYLGDGGIDEFGLEPGARQGVALGQLDLLGIPYEILSPDTEDSAFRECFSSLLDSLKAGKTAALVIKKGALTSDHHPAYPSGNLLHREQAAELILSSSSPSDIFVSTTGKLSREIFELREKMQCDHSRDFLTVGSMGHASMIALRIAEEKPDRRVWCLDGDGALMMHLGALPLIGQRHPANLVHVVINNGAHETVGGMPVCSGSLDICSLARSAGYSSVCTADTPDSLREVLSGLSRASGPVLLEVRCACGSRADLGRPTTTPVENRDAFMRFLES